MMSTKDSIMDILPPENINEKLKRCAYLQHLLEVYLSREDDKPREVPIWETWLQKSGELPPNFDDLPSIATLPDVLSFQDGTRVTTPKEWGRRRKEILEILRYYQLGNWPPPPPSIAAYEMDSSEDKELNCIKKLIVLDFAPTEEALKKTRWFREGERTHPPDPAHFKTAHLKIELLIPHGKGPFPAVVGVGAQPFPAVMGSYDGRIWWLPRLEIGSDHSLRKGYVICTFDSDDAFAIKDVYTEYDCNQLVWWAWAASRCIDYLYTLSIIDRKKISVMGHSRNGKMTLICAALDERVCAAIASHNGAGSGMTEPWRYIGEKYGGETLEASTRLFPYWNHPRMRFFAGRENKLPFDSHFMIALVAPRPLLITEGDRDSVGEPWGAQQAYIAAKEVYGLLGLKDKLNLTFSHGEHELDDATLEMYADWIDMQLSRKPNNFVEKIMYTYTFAKWKEVTGESVDVNMFPEKGLDDLLLGSDGETIRTPENWKAKKKDLKKRVMWVLGELPSYKRPSSVSLMDTRTEGNLIKAKLPIDEKLICHLTWSAGKEGKLPTVIYCHAYLDQRGFDWPRGYGWGTSVGERLAQKGFLAVEFDQFGYGTRNHDCGIEFYVESPHQSAMAVMVQDVRRIIDALSDIEIVDHDRIMVIGYSLGGAVALHVAALDERVKAVASVCGFASMRMDAHGNATEGLKRYYYLRPTLPRLGFFVGNEKRVPYDYHEILAMIAPRAVFILAPILDQDWFLEDVKRCYEEACKVYQILSAPDNIEFYTPNDFNRFTAEYQNRVNDWLWKLVNP
jgi:cephalosporin-C deacetylase-like acetyl esterase